MNTMNDLKNLVELTLAQNDIWTRCGEVLIQAYENRLAGGGVQFNLRRGTSQNEPDIRVMETTPGYFTVAVVPFNNASIEYGENTRTFSMTDSLELIRTAFPHGRNIHAIIDSLLMGTDQP